MPKLNLAQQEVALPKSKDFDEFVNSRPWRGGLKRVARDVWPSWPHDVARGEGRVVGPGIVEGQNPEAPGLEFLAEVASGILGGAEGGNQSARSSMSDGRGDSLAPGKKGSRLGLRDGETMGGKVVEENNGNDGRGFAVPGLGESDPSSEHGGGGEELMFHAGMQLARILRESEGTTPNELPTRVHEPSYLLSGERTQGGDKLVATQLTNLLSSCQTCLQTRCKCKKRNQLSCFPDPELYGVAPGFDVEVKFRQSTAEGTSLGSPWLCIWACCQSCGVTRTMDRRERVQDFLLEHGGHDPRWSNLKVSDFDFRIDHGTRDLYREFSEALRAGQLQYGERDSLIPTVLLGPRRDGLQAKIRHFEKLLIAGAAMREELEKRAQSVRKRKSKQPGQTPDSEAKKRKRKSPENGLNQGTAGMLTTKSAAPCGDQQELVTSLTNNSQQAPLSEFSRTLGIYLCSASKFDLDADDYPLPCHDADVAEHRSSPGALEPIPDIQEVDKLHLNSIGNKVQSFCHPIPKPQDCQRCTFVESAAPAIVTQQLESPESSMEHLATSCSPNVLTEEPRILNTDQTKFGSHSFEWSDPPETYFTMVPVSQLQGALAKSSQNIRLH